MVVLQLCSIVATATTLEHQACHRHSRSVHSTPTWMTSGSVVCSCSGAKGVFSSECIALLLNAQSNPASKSPRRYLVLGDVVTRVHRLQASNGQSFHCAAKPHAPGCAPRPQHWFRLGPHVAHKSAVRMLRMTTIGSTIRVTSTFQNQLHTAYQRLMLSTETLCTTTSETAT